MIISVDEAMTLGQFEQSKYGILSELIPRVQKWLCSYLNNYFETDNYTISSGITFTHNEGSADTIVDSESTFDDDEVEFADDMDFIVQGSHRNNDLFHADTVTASTITLTNDAFNQLITEASGKSVYITRVRFPQDIQIPFIELLRHFSEKRNPAIQSKSLGGRSVTYFGEGGLPKALLSEFNPWKKLRI